MALENLRKSCIYFSVFFASVSLPVCGFAQTANTAQTQPRTTTYTIQENGEPTTPAAVSSGGAAPSTYSTSAPGKPDATGPTTTTTMVPAGVSSKSHIIEKQASININDHVVMISGSLSYGLVNGKSRELVYDTSTGHKNSELDWQLSNVSMVGVGASIKPLSWLRLNGNFWFKVSEGDGNIDDYDWRLYGYDDWTDWSHSPTNVTEGIMYDVNMELTFLRFNQTSLYGIVGFKHDHWKWEAHGGTFIYSSYYVRDTVGSFPSDELVLTYEQTYDVPYIGIGFHANLDPVTLTGRIIGSTLVSSSDEDNHPLRDLNISSSLDDGKMWGIDFACTYNFTPHIAATAAFQYTKYEEIKGDKNWNFYSEGDRFTYGGGLDNQSTLAYLSLLVNI